MLIPKIVEVSRDYTGHVYVLVEFRDPRDGPAVLVEEFIMQIPETLYDTDTQQQVPVDVRAWMRQNIANFTDLADASNWRGDFTEGPPGQQIRARDRNDVTGIVGTLKAEVGQEVTRTVRPVR